MAWGLSPYHAGSVIGLAFYLAGVCVFTVYRRAEVRKRRKACLALWGTFEDTGILQDPGEDLAGFPQEDFPGGGGGEYVLLFQTIHPVGVFCQGDIGADVPALDNGLL